MNPAPGMKMTAMVFATPGQPLRAETRPVPAPGPGEILVRIHACGVCRTDLHAIDGELPDPKVPIVPGHEIVGRVAALGARSGQAIPRRVRPRSSTRRSCSRRWARWCRSRFGRSVPAARWFAAVST